MGLEEEFERGFAKIMGLAAGEARKLWHGYIGTEHLLLALIHIKEPQSYEPPVESSHQERYRSQIEQILIESDATPSNPEVYELLEYVGVDSIRIKSAIDYIQGKGIIEPKTPPPLTPLIPHVQRVHDLAYSSYVNDREPRLPASIHVL